jgi:RecA/RadA recombinase
MLKRAGFASMPQADPPQREARPNGGNGEDREPSLLIWYGDEPRAPPKYLVENTLPEEGIAIICGQFTLGKTFVAADLAAAVMTGGSFAGEPTMRKGAVLWFAAEGKKEIERRVAASVENKFGASGRQPFARQAEGVPLLTEPDALAKLKAHAQEAAKCARERFNLPLALIVIDTVSAAAGFSRKQRVRNARGHDHPAGAIARDGHFGGAD